MAEVEIPDPNEIKEHGASPFTKTVALSTACIAVVLAIASVGGSNAAKEMMKSQIEAANRWAQYQAKSIRERMAEQEIRRLQIEVAAREGDASANAGKIRDLLNKELEYYASEKKQYGSDKKEIGDIANELTKESFTNQRKDGYFDTAEMLLQIAIVMASVAMLADSRLAYGVAMTLALAGAFFAFDGFTLKFPIGFLEPSAEEKKADDKKPDEPKGGGKHAMIAAPASWEARA